MMVRSIPIAFVLGSTKNKPIPSLSPAFCRPRHQDQDIGDMALDHERS